MYADSGAFSPDYPEIYLDVSLIHCTKYGQICPSRLKSVTYFINKPALCSPNAWPTRRYLCSHVHWNCDAPILQAWDIAKNLCKEIRCKFSSNSIVVWSARAASFGL